MLSHDYSCLAVQGAQREAAATAERLDLAEGRHRSRVRVGPELGQGWARVGPGLGQGAMPPWWRRSALPRPLCGWLPWRLAALRTRDESSSRPGVQWETCGTGRAARPTSPIPRRCTRSCSKLMLLLEAAHAASTAGASQLSVARAELRGLDEQSAALHERAVRAEAWGAGMARERGVAGSIRPGPQQLTRSHSPSEAHPASRRLP